MRRSATPKRRKTGGGSRKGKPNRATANAREAISQLIDGNVSRLQEWLDRIAKTDGPLAAWRCFVDLLEFSVPKLTRSEVTATVAATKLERPITSAQEAADVYRQIMEGTVDIASVRFESRQMAAPQPASPAPLPEPVVTPIAAPVQPEVAEPASASVFAKLGRAP